MSKPPRRPSSKELFEIWLAAIRGDDEAKRKLFALQLRYPATQKSLRQFATQRTADARQRQKQLGLKSTKPQSNWQKASDTVSKSGVTLVSGGLPSLGKK